MQSEYIIQIPKTNSYLYEQEIKLSASKNEAKIYLGIGILNSNNEISIDLPLDFLIIIESLKTLKNMFIANNIGIFVSILIADKNAEIALREKNIFEPNKEQWTLAKTKYQEKIKTILDKNGFSQEIYEIIQGSDLYNQNEYRTYCDNLSNKTKFLSYTTSYSKEQILTMNYYKNKLGYDFRLSWKRKEKGHKKSNNRDEKAFDDEYRETFKEEPLISIFYQHGLKLSDDNGGVGFAVPYSYFPSENGKRIALDEKVDLKDIDYFCRRLNKKNLKKFDDLYGKEKMEKESLSESILRKIKFIFK